MDRKIKEQLLDIYDKKREFIFSETYSKGNTGQVFTKPDDKFHWLVLDEKGKDHIEVRQTDDTGFITNRDSYKVKDNALELVNSECYTKNRHGKISIKDQLAIYKAKAEEMNKNRIVHQKQDRQKERIIQL